MSVAACVGRPLPEPDAALAAASGRALPTLQEGRRIYAMSCSGCHRPYQPSEHSATTWKDIMPVMVTKAKLMSDQADKVTAYIDAFVNSRSNPPATGP